MRIKSFEFPPVNTKAIHQVIDNGHAILLGMGSEVGILYRG